MGTTTTTMTSSDALDTRAKTETDMTKDVLSKMMILTKLMICFFRLCRYGATS